MKVVFAGAANAELGDIRDRLAADNPTWVIICIFHGAYDYLLGEDAEGEL